MFASVVHVKPHNLHAAKASVQSFANSKGFPDISSIKGFKAYYSFQDDEWVTSIAIFEDAAGRDQWWEMCRAAFGQTWDEHVKPQPGTVKWTAGEVTYHKVA